MPPAGESQPIRYLQPAADLIAFFQRIVARSPETPLRISLDGKPFGKVILGPFEIPAHFVEWATINRNTWAIVKAFDLHDTAGATTEALLEQKPSIEMFAACLRGDTLGGRIMFHCESLSSPAVCFPSVIQVVLDTDVLLAFCAYFGHASPTGDENEGYPEYVMPVDRVELITRRLLDAQTDPEQLSIPILRAIAAQYEATYDVMSWWSDPENGQSRASE